MSKKGPLLFLLGAGASVDSGLRPYRGLGGIYSELDMDELPISTHELRSDEGMCAMWEFLAPLYQSIAEHEPGPTYAAIQRLIDAMAGEPCHVVTQNIDGYARSLKRVHGLTELHGHCGTMTCFSCGAQLLANAIQPRHAECAVPIMCWGHQEGDAPWCRPNIVLYGEDVPEARGMELCSFVNRAHPVYVIVIGTTLQFPYLRKRIINKAKSRGAKVIHVNPECPMPLKTGEQWVSSIGELETLFL